jgi:hypothetical protein
MPAPTSLRLSHTHVMHLPFPPEAVFPLLCPVREADWLRGWEARMVHSASGFAEPGCVFATPGLDGTEWIWVVSRHVPSSAVQFVVQAPGSHVTVLDITLQPESEGCRAAWIYTLTALDPSRGAWHRDYMAATPGRLVGLEARLAHFLRAGTCL